MDELYVMMMDLREAVNDFIHAEDVMGDSIKVAHIEQLLDSMKDQIHEIEKARWAVAKYEMLSKKRFYDVPKMSANNEIQRPGKAY